MAMAMRTAAARVAAAKPCGLRGLFSTLTSTSPFIPPPSSQADNRPPPAEPSDNLFLICIRFTCLNWCLAAWLSKRTTTEGLREAFAKFGEVVDARVVTDRVSGYSKGFGFVRYATLEDAAEGIKGMDGKFLDGWVIFAEYARPRPPLPGSNAGPPSYQPGYGSQYGRRLPLGMPSPYSVCDQREREREEEEEEEVAVTCRPLSPAAVRSGTRDERTAEGSVIV
ncbi:hypothetical protein RHMOL_Rhmol04G0027800 [Rhododendron molle]|uniref:Uncharacterized protein n=1 Tax=Rhododendron molle TaxID=49168 RepID=A0ACC0NXP4_RHOML|nr:hypothetical protein RHMOL_Rhmol04G0027800 [Rhododendron molle]